MFKFGREQNVFEVGGVKLGGQPGQLPTVLIGSIFYRGDPIVRDEKEGFFDKKKAEDILKREEELSAQTGNPRMIDVVGSWPKAIERYVDFVADSTDSPFLIDGATAEVRIAGAEHVKEVGLTERALYNTISFGIKPEEVEAIKDSGLESAVVLALNPRKPTIEGRMEILKGVGEAKGLLGTAEEAGIRKILVDVCILDVPDLGTAAKSIFMVKSELGLPAGCGAHNAMDMWASRKKLDPVTYLISNSVAQTTPILMGADFALYGPMGRAPQVYPAIALADAYVAYCMRQEFKIGPLTKEHPLFKIFR